MLICCHGSGHFGEARKNMNYTQHIHSMLKRPSYSLLSTSHLLENIVSRIMNTVPP